MDHRPSGRLIQTFAGTDIDGNPIYRTRELETGEHIPSGTADAAGYGNTSVERAQFIIGTIRTHLTHQGRSHHLDKLDEMDVLLGGPVRWCPRCGAHLPGR